MKREIKFRAWHELNKEMIYPYAKGFNNILSNGDILNRFENVMQFTGLHDKNGTEICEGDIVKLTPIGSKYDNYSFAVVYLFGSFQMKKEDIPPLSFVYMSVQMRGQSKIKYDDDIFKHIEVIGNIYQNPELLNK